MIDLSKALEEAHPQTEERVAFFALASAVLQGNDFKENEALEYWVNQIEARDEFPFKEALKPAYRRIFTLLFNGAVHLRCCLDDPGNMKLRLNNLAKTEYFKLEKQRLLIEQQLQKINYSIDKFQNFSLFLETEKREIEANLTGICGTCPYDPNSSIHKAWLTSIPKRQSSPENRGIIQICMSLEPERRRDYQELERQREGLENELRLNAIDIANFKKLEMGLDPDPASRCRRLSEFGEQLESELLAAHSAVKEKAPDVDAPQPEDPWDAFGLDLSDE